MKQWHPEEALKKWVVKNRYTLSDTAVKADLVLPYLYKAGDDIAIRELEAAVIKAAKIVQQLGIDYIDIFNRAEKELENAKRQRDALKKIEHIATKQTPVALHPKSDLIQPTSFLLQAWADAISGTDVFMPH